MTFGTARRGNLELDQLEAQLDAIRTLGDVYEKKRRIERLIDACEDVQESELPAPAWNELQHHRGTLVSLLQGLPASVRDDGGDQVGGGGDEVIGETLDELFGGLNIAGAREGPVTAPPLSTPAGGFTEGTKVVELKPGRQYRTVRRKGVREDGVVVHVKGGVQGRHPESLDATSADEKEDEVARGIGNGGVRETARAEGMTGANADVDDTDAALLEAARYGDCPGNPRNRDSTKPCVMVEIPVDGEMLARAAAGAARGRQGEACPSSSGGSTHAVVGRNGGDWYGRVGADERRVREGGDTRSESSGSESGESLTSPAMVVQSGFKSYE
jgi:hypothetical protein